MAPRRRALVTSYRPDMRVFEEVFSAGRRPIGLNGLRDLQNKIYRPRFRRPRPAAAFTEVLTTLLPVPRVPGGAACSTASRI